jgi:hypothetical protein
VCISGTFDTTPQEMTIVTAEDDKHGLCYECINPAKPELGTAWLREEDLTPISKDTKV